MSTAPLDHLDGALGVDDPAYARRLRRRRIFALGFLVISGFATLLSVIILAALLGQVFADGSGVISGEFFRNGPSRLEPESSGIFYALWGTVYLMLMTIGFSVPLGVGAAIYLQEYAPRNRLNKLIEVNIANLAGVPSIVYGLLGLTIFVNLFQFRSGLLSGSLTMALLILPVVIIAAREAIAAVPDSIRLGAYALGATRWQTVRAHVLPAALPGILTGIIIALSRAIGEAAPLIVLGAATYVSTLPSDVWDDYTVLPIQIYSWVQEPDGDLYRPLTAGAIIVLLGVLVILNGIASALRAWQQRKL